MTAIRIGFLTAYAGLLLPAATLEAAGPRSSRVCSSCHAEDGRPYLPVPLFLWTYPGVGYLCPALDLLVGIIFEGNTDVEQ